MGALAVVKSKHLFCSLLHLIILTFFLFCPGANSFGAVLPREGSIKNAEIVRVEGDGWVRFVKREDWLSAVRQQVLTAGDTLRTGRYGKMAILFSDSTQIRMNKNSSLLIREAGQTGSGKGNMLRLEVGEVWSRAKTSTDVLRIETPSATAAIRGTDWDLSVDEKGKSSLTVLRGSVELYNDFGKVVVGEGETAEAEVGRPPAKLFVIRPKDKVQWLAAYQLEVEKLIHFHSYRRQEVIELLPLAKKKADEDPSDLKAKLFLAGLFFDLREPHNSTRLFDEVLSKEPANKRALTFRGLLALGKGETEKADAYFRDAERDARGNERTEALIGLVGVHLQRNEMGKAAALIQELGQGNAGPVAGLVAVGFNALQGDFEGALKVCKDYEARFPGDERFPAFEANLYIVMEESDKVQPALKKSFSINQSYAFAYAVLGFHHYLEGRGSDAEEALQKALAFDPADDMAINSMVLLMRDRGNYEEAFRFSDLGLLTHPGDVALLANRALIFSDVEDLKHAQDNFKKLSEEQSGIPVGSLGLGLIALKEGRTEEAVQYALRASLLSPNYTDPHLALAVAYYQLGDIQKALDEIRLAEQLDPRDPVPHNMAYIIYQDNYRIFDAIQEAKKTLELLQYQKSVVPIENSRQGEENLGSALMDFGLNEWATSYALESYDPLNASSHFFAAAKYRDLSSLSLSELIQGLILDPLSLSSSNRYSDIYRRPRHDLTVGTTLGDAGGGFSQTYEATLQGFFRKPWETSYYLSYETNEDKGYRENGYGRASSLFYGIGAKPDYKNSFFIYGGLTGSKSGEPGQIQYPDNDDRNESRGTMFSLGYRHRFGHRNDFLGNIFYRNLESEFINPGLYKTAGLTDLALSFLSQFSNTRTRTFFQKGIYDLTQIIGGDNTTLVTDSTGTVAQSYALSPIPDTLPSAIDFDSAHSNRLRYKTLAFQTRHQLDIGEDHQFTYGVEYLKDSLKTTSYGLRKTGTIDFCDDVLLPAVTCSQFDSVTSQIAKADSALRHNLLFAYVDDRWKLSPNLLIEGGLNYVSLKKDHDYSGLHPRLGLVMKAGSNTLRIAYQKWLTPSATAPTLMPVSSAGLIVDDRRVLPGARINDYQVRVESRWSGRLFTELLAERVEFKNPLSSSLQEGETTVFGAAINAILTNRLGLFLRYQYANSRNKTGAYEGLNIENVPWHSASGGVVWVSPKHIKALLSTTYVGRQFSDSENSYKMADHLTTDLSVIWEPFKKHMMFSLALNNIFDKHYETAQGYPVAGRSFFLSLEYRF